MEIKGKIIDRYTNQTSDGIIENKIDAIDKRLIALEDQHLLSDYKEREIFASYLAELTINGAKEALGKATRGVSTKAFETYDNLSEKVAKAEKSKGIKAAREEFANASQPTDIIDKVQTDFNDYLEDVKTNMPLLDEYSKVSDDIGSSRKKRKKFVENVCKAKKIQFQNTR